MPRKLRLAPQDDFHHTSIIDNMQIAGQLYYTGVRGGTFT